MYYLFLVKIDRELINFSQGIVLITSKNDYPFAS